MCFARSDKNVSLIGKRYAVTGGTGGMGQAIAQALKTAGATPLCISRSSVEFPADLTDYHATERLFKDIEQVYGPLDGLINGLGRLKVKEVAALGVDEIKELIETNFSSVVYSCKCAKLKTGGHIINIASSAYLQGRKDFAIYAGAKAAVVNFSQALAEERKEISVNTLVPQRTNTSMRHEYFPDEDKTSLLDPKEIAEAVLSLLRQERTTGGVVEVRKTYL
jgi:NAD(P)-dependent dehydrogenase (short-subunit alcohol dehydrogenase family)